MNCSKCMHQSVILRGTESKFRRPWENNIVRDKSGGRRTMSCASHHEKGFGFPPAAATSAPRRIYVRGMRLGSVTPVSPPHRRTLRWDAETSHENHFAHTSQQLQQF